MLQCKSDGKPELFFGFTCELNSVKLIVLNTMSLSVSFFSFKTPLCLSTVFTISMSVSSDDTQQMGL